MTKFKFLFVAALCVLCPSAAHAQLYEDVGTRAQGLGGAFVAVADDATATWWNPAGLAKGPLFSSIVEKGHANQPDDPVGLEPARRVGGSAFATALPSFGVSYYRHRVSQIGPSSSTEAS